MDMQESIHWPSCIDRLCPGCMPKLDVVREVEYKASHGKSILVAHQRTGDGGPCRCGWNKLGKSHAEHQVQILVEAGVIE